MKPLLLILLLAAGCANQPTDKEILTKALEAVKANSTEFMHDGSGVQYCPESDPIGFNYFVTQDYWVIMVSCPEGWTKTYTGENGETCYRSESFSYCDPPEQEVEEYTDEQGRQCYSGWRKVTNLDYEGFSYCDPLPIDWCEVYPCA